MHTTTRRGWTVIVLLLAAMAALMFRPIREESATADEPWVLAAGYAYDTGAGFRMDPEQPPLAKMWSALPLTLMDVKLSESAIALMQGRTVNPLARTWTGAWQPLAQLFPQGSESWYYWPWKESNILGQMMVYGSGNNAENLLFAGRVMQVVLTLLTGMLIFLWAKQLAGLQAGFLGLAVWGSNPLALSYGHLIQTDAAATLTILASTWVFGQMLKRPSPRNACLAGAVYGVALATKLSALVLPAAFVIVALYLWRVQPTGAGRTRDFSKALLVFTFSAWVMTMLAYIPDWSPAPALAPEQASALGIPRWFQVLRPILLPRDFFKSVALLTSAATTGEHWGFLMGEWRTTGWWYYFPAAMLLKTPIPLLLLMAGGLVLCVVHIKQRSELVVPWIVAAVYMAFSMASTINIGIRHLLPVYALMAVGIATQIAKEGRALRTGAWILCGWMAVVAVWAHPFYIEYFNEFAGGSKNGYHYLLDSNLDWGQDVKRLKQYLDDHQIQHVYLDYFGVQRAIEYYGVANTRVTAEQAKQVRDGVLVVSAMDLMRPEWDWLRQQQQPMARIGYTLFVYKLTG